jgi:hypothetical protein
VIESGGNIHGVTCRPDDKMSNGVESERFGLRETALDQLERVAHVRREEDVKWCPIADLREEISGRAGDQFQGNLRMRFVERAVEFFKAEDQIGGSCDRELAGARRPPANCRDGQQNNQRTPHAELLTFAKM